MLKEISLSRDGAVKLQKKNYELYFGDIEDNVKSCIPGEWVIFKNTKKNISYIGYINPLVDNKFCCAHVFSEASGILDEKEYLFSLINLSISKRELFRGYKANARLVYGNADSIPGLLVDSYKNCLIIQINTAGIDRFRTEIKDFFAKKYTEKKIYILDNKKYREREMLPFFENQDEIDDVKVIENELHFEVNKDVLQKIGYYYDHRENRKRASELVKKFNKKFRNGLDLFCYVGSWGVNLLEAGCEKITFVDQGNFESSVENNLSLNNMSEKGSFVRDDVFKYLKSMNDERQKFDLICSDPPAFCKSKKEQKRAYDGYLKLHKEIFRLLEKDSLFIACSCTYYIDYDSFERNVQEAAIQTGRKIQLIDVGIQGFDHPTEKLINKNTYLKYFAYLVE